MIYIRQCSCTSEYQDRKYGKGNRVHNDLGPKKKDLCRCTVCEKERSI